jgi:hypothetical protein
MAEKFLVSGGGGGAGMLSSQTFHLQKGEVFRKVECQKTRRWLVPIKPTLIKHT